MKHLSYRVIENRKLNAGIQLLTLDAPELGHAIRPGQFALARDPMMLDPYLRRTLWVYEIKNAGVTFSIASDDALALRTREGDTLDLLAPLGHAINFESPVQHVLLIGENNLIAPLIAIAHDAVAHERPVVIVHRQTSNDTFPVHVLAPEIEYRTEVDFDAELIMWADAIVASGTLEWYRVIAERIIAARYRLEPGLARAFIDVPMPCGTGTCYACAIDTLHGVKLACTHGAWFDLVELEQRSHR